MTNSERMSIYEWCDKNKGNIGVSRVVKNITPLDRRYLRESLVCRRDYVGMEVLPKETPTAKTRSVRIVITEPRNQQQQ